MSIKSKISALLFNPKGVVEKYILKNSVVTQKQVKYIIANSRKVIAHGIKISEWKRKYIQDKYPEYDWIFYPFKTSAEKVFENISDNRAKHRIIVWGYEESPSFSILAKKNSVKFYRMEDGFVRSVGLGANHELPSSLVLDKTGTLYFDARAPSGLENILNTYDFDNDKGLMLKAKNALNLLIENGVSKYNHIERKSAQSIYQKYCSPVTGMKRVLVIGQVESDASIKYGSEKVLNNALLVKKARADNPNAQIFYKPHPDILAGKREIGSGSEVIGKFAHIITEPLSLVDSFYSMDEVYTISSLSGFEALMRGIKVTTMGCPFYSGWGLTEDLQKNVRRKRILTVEQLFAGAYILYPDYFELKGHGRTDISNVINKIKLNIGNMKYNTMTINSKFECENKVTKIISENQPNLINISSKSYIEGQPRTILFGFGMHKMSFYLSLFSERDLFTIDATVAKQSTLFVNDVLAICKLKKGDEFIVWGKKDNPELQAKLKEIGVKISRIEDAFIRSIGLGGHHASPLSYIYDETGGIYFDASEPSKLEDILNTYDFKSNPILIERAKKCIDRMVNDQMSKYNYAEKVNIENIYGAKDKKRILVIGQVEDDASILYGCEQRITNNDLVLKAYFENPGAQIIYKPHPDVLTGLRKRLSDPSLVENIAMVLYDSISISDALQTVDHVYTITSLTGFEALMRGVPVTTIGSPFYSGWGLTDDRQYNSRRNRKLSVEEVFAGTYILYSCYVNPYTKEKISIEEALDLLEWMKKTDIQPYDIKTNYSTNNAILAKTEAFIESGQFKDALASANLAVGSFGDIASYLIRAKARVAQGIIGDKVKNDFIYACKISNYQNINALVMYAKYLWEFEGYDTDLHNVISILLKLNKLNSTKKELLAAMLCDGGYIKKAYDLLDGMYNLSDKRHLSGRVKLDATLSSVLGCSDECPATSIYNKIRKSTATFESIIRSNPSSFCIVGNSPIELGKQQGEQIDKFSHVIRFNSFDTTYPNAIDYGNKTDIWIRTPKNMSNIPDRINDDIKLVIISGSNWINRLEDGVFTFDDLISDYCNVGVIPFYIYSKLANKISSPPSAGIQVLFWIYSMIGPINKEQIFGFELTDQPEGRNSLYSSDKNKVVRHNWITERKLFDELIKV